MLSHRQPDHSGLLHAHLEEHPNAPPQTYTGSQHHDQQSNPFDDTQQPKRKPTYSISTFPSPTSPESQQQSVKFNTQPLAGPSSPTSAKLPPCGNSMSLLALKGNRTAAELYEPRVPRPNKRYLCGLRLRWLIVTIIVSLCIMATAIGGTLGVSLRGVHH